MFVVKLRDTHYLYGSQAKSTQWTKDQRHARRFATAFEAWRWIVANTYASPRSPTRTNYRVVRLRPRCCRCAS